MDVNETIIELGGVRVTATAVEELDTDGTPLVSVPRDNITAMHLAHGYIAERLVLSLVLGVTLTFSGLVVGGLLAHTLLVPTERVSRRAAYLLTACATTLVVGPWLSLRSLRRGSFVAVNLGSDSRKLAFRSTTNFEELTRFARTLSESPLWEGVLRNSNSSLGRKSSVRQYFGNLF